jgi:lipopolysaccharide transport system ATP-binding protein
MNGAILGMSRAEIQSKLDEIIDFSGCERYIDTPVKRYSSGMTVRLGFAVAAFLEPEILVVDEVLAVGDAEFQKKAIGKMKDVSQGQGRTVLFVSHNMASIEQLCTRGIMLENGMIKMDGDVHNVVECYLRDNADSFTLREGTGALLFSDYSVDKDLINMGDDLEITMKVTARRPIDKWMIHINIYNANGSYTAQMITDDDPSFTITKLEPNVPVTLKCKIKNINAAPGHYRINLWSGDGYEWFDWLKECMSFSIRQGLYLGRTTTYKDDALMAFRSEWNKI